MKISTVKIGFGGQKDFNRHEAAKKHTGMVFESTLKADADALLAE